MEYIVVNHTWRMLTSCFANEAALSFDILALVFNVLAFAVYHHGRLRVVFAIFLQYSSIARSLGNKLTRRLSRWLSGLLRIGFVVNPGAFFAGSYNESKNHDWV